MDRDIFKEVSGTRYYTKLEFSMLYTVPIDAPANINLKGKYCDFAVSEVWQTYCRQTYVRSIFLSECKISHPKMA